MTVREFDPVRALYAIVEEARTCDDARFGALVSGYCQRCHSWVTNGKALMNVPAWVVAIGAVEEAARANDEISAASSRIKNIRDVLRTITPDPSDFAVSTTPGDPDPAVLEHLVMSETRSGEPTVKPVLANVVRIFEHDGRWSDRIAYNAFRGVVEVDNDPVADVVETDANVWISDHYGIHMSTRTVSEALVSVAHRRAYHPVRDWLTGLEWDGTPRVDGLMARYFGAEDTPLHSAVSMRWMVSAVARVMPSGTGQRGQGGPGCKADTMIVLVGKQGRGKSTALRVLAGKEWFRDSDLMLGDKDAYQALRGVWIYELAEIDGMYKREAAEVKAFLSSQVDRYRPPYGRHEIEQPRQCVFAGTTNHRDFLTDPTGARRFWPVEVGHIQLEALSRDRGQLWAEAVALYHGGEAWWMTAREDELMREAHDGFRRVDSIEDVVFSFLRSQAPRKGWRIIDIATGVYETQAGKVSRRDQDRIRDVLKAHGWESKPVRVDASTGTQRRWVPPNGGE